jgi:hypothetical protein
MVDKLLKPLALCPYCEWITTYGHGAMRSWKEHLKQVDFHKDMRSDKDGFKGHRHHDAL